jgi:CDP-diacylglycerol--serine O-phosphatidyltransferase
VQGDLSVAGQVKRKRPSFRQLIPNLVTIFVICLGLTSVRFGLEGKFGYAMLMIVLAAFLDAADGRIARILDSVTPIGAELDSLADFFNFGIAPGLLLYMAIFTGTEHANLGWFAVLALGVCCSLRLARFNVALVRTDVPAWKSEFFVGVPAPMVGCLALLPLFLLMLGFEEIKEYDRTIFVYLVIVGLLAVSTLPTFSIKHIHINPDRLLYVLVGCAAAIASLSVFTWETLIVADVLYILSLPVSFKVYRRRLKREASAG